MMSGGARYMSSSVTVLPKTMRPVKVAMKVMDTIYLSNAFT